MKKIILGVTMLAIAASTIFVACKKEEKPFQNPTTIKKDQLSNARVTTGLISPAEMDLILAISGDSLFQELVRIRVAEHNNAILNGNAIKNLLDAGITATNATEYANLLGYPNTEVFIQTTNLCKTLESSLNEEYQIFSMRNDLVAEAIALTSPIYTTPPVVIMGAKSSTCGTIYTNTIIQIAAETVMMHGACGGLDALCLPCGIVCHGAAVVWQISSSNIALANYEACR